MTHVVTSGCVDHKYQECVAVCPVEAFREADTYLVIDPDECIDCGACIPECPVDAIEQGEQDNKWYDLNYKWSNTWPNISLARPEDVPADAEKWKGVSNKIEHFSEKPGKGD